MDKNSSSSDVDDPRSFSHHFAQINRIRVHYVDEGKGPLLILLHGFPYLWFWWRRQIKALAAAGYRVIAPDMRGFGQTDGPDSVDDYNVTLLVGDVVGLMKAVGETSAVLIGHDMGVAPAYYGALLRPDLFHAVVTLCSPPAARGPAKPSVTWKALGTNERVFYQQYVQVPGRAERELAIDTRKSLRAMMYSVSGSAHGSDRWRLLVEKDETIVDTFKEPAHFPAWLSDEALDYYVSEYIRSGWVGGMNHYRVRDLNWELTSFLDDAVVRQPSMFIGGADDPGFELFSSAYEQIETHMPGLRKKILLEGVGHGAAEEKPQVVTELILDFLAGLRTN
jgi:pimeloyl-ACP methyl ester carboxylesterase